MFPHNGSLDVQSFDLAMSILTSHFFAAKRTVLSKLIEASRSPRLFFLRCGFEALRCKFNRFLEVSEFRMGCCLHGEWIPVLTAHL
jgi:hypothetical protein